MCNIENSFFSLVSNNNGMFKSEKQASFLLSFTRNNIFLTSVKQHDLGSDYNFKICGSSQHEFLCDDIGIYQVNKINSKCKVTLYWKREDQGHGREYTEHITEAGLGLMQGLYSKLCIDSKGNEFAILSFH
jgi:hypothetical protein